MSKKAPKAPDPMQTAQTQAGMNRQAAQDTLRINAMDKTNPYGSSTFTRDAAGNPTGMTSEFTGPMKTGFDNVGGSFANYTGRLPTENFDSTKIAQTDDLSRTFYNRGRDLLADDFSQAQQAQDINLTNRGLPIGSEARTISEGNLARQQGLALSTLAKDASLLAPQEQQRLIDNARRDYTMTFDNADRSLGLLSGMNGLLPQVSQPTAGVGNVDFAGLQANKFKADQQAHSDKMAGYGSLLKTGLGLALTPMTGGLSSTLLGGMLGAGATAAPAVSAATQGLMAASPYMFGGYDPDPRRAYA